MRSRPPIAIIVASALAIALLVVPGIGLLQRTPWSRLGELATSDATLEAARLSLIVSVSATLLSIFLGVPLGWLLARVDFVGRRFVRAVVVLPMVLPPVVGGVALLLALGRRGLVGQWLDRWFGLTLPFTTAGAVLAATFVALPFMVTAVEGGVAALDTEPEEAAASLGASPLRVIMGITLPRARGALAAGMALTWARALGEFGATVTFASSVPGRTQTLPLATYERLQTDPEAAIALSLIMLAVSLGVLVLLRDRWSFSR